MVGCTTQNVNTKASECLTYYGHVTRVALVKKDWSIPIADLEGADGLGKLMTDVMGYEVFPLKETTADIEQNNTEVGVQRYLNRDIKNDSGQYQWTYSPSLQAFERTEYDKFTGKDDLAFIALTDQDVIIGQSRDGVNFKGVPLTSFISNLMSFPTMVSDIQIQLSPYALRFNPEAFATYFYAAEVQFDVTMLDGVGEVTLVADGTPTATSLVLDAILGDGTTPSDLIPADGQTVDDIWTLTGAGTLDSVAYDAQTQKYTFVATGLTTGDTIKLALMSVSQIPYVSNELTLTI